MKNIAVLDASSIIKGALKEVDYTIGYIPEKVLNEVKSEHAREKYMHHSYKIEVRNASDKYVEIARAKAKELGYSQLSVPDIELAALALELTEEIPSVFSSWIGSEALPSQRVICITQDMALKNLLSKLGVDMHEDYFEEGRRYLQRCHTCEKIYKGDKQVDFCKHCGYATVTKVSYFEDNDKFHLFLSKNFPYKENKITFRGKNIKSEDQKEYKWYCASKRKQERLDEKKNKLLFEEKNWFI